MTSPLPFGATTDRCTSCGARRSLFREDNGPWKCAPCHSRRQWPDDGDTEPTVDGSPMRDLVVVVMGVGVLVAVGCAVVAWLRGGA